MPRQKSINSRFNYGYRLAIRLSKLVEILLGKYFIMLEVSNADLYDEYSVKSSGRTVAKLFDISQTISVLFGTNEYVQCLLIDFTKGFDSVDRAVLT